MKTKNVTAIGVLLLGLTIPVLAGAQSDEPPDIDPNFLKDQTSNWQTSFADAHIAQLQASLPGSCYQRPIRIGVVDSDQAKDDDHYNAEGSYLKAIMPNATITGSTMIGGSVDAFDLAINTLPGVFGLPGAESFGQLRRDQARTCLQKQSGADVIDWVANLEALSNQDLVSLLESDMKPASQHQVIVMGVSTLSVAQLNDPAVRQALKDAHIVLVDSPLRTDTPGQIVGPSPDQARSGAGPSLTVSFPSSLGQLSVATPAVAGAIALTMAGNRNLTALDVYTLLTTPGTFTKSILTDGNSTIPALQTVSQVPAFDGVEFQAAANRTYPPISECDGLPLPTLLPPHLPPTTTGPSSTGTPTVTNGTTAKPIVNPGPIAPTATPTAQPTSSGFTGALGSAGGDR